jgi:hypothetical protein
MIKTVELMTNMVSHNLPEHFTEVPRSISELIGETLFRRSLKTFKHDMIIDQDTSSEDEAPKRNLDRVSLGLNAPPKDRLFDTKIEFTASGTNQEGVFKLEVTFDTEKQLSEVVETRKEEIAMAAKIRIRMWKRSKGQILLSAKSVDLVLQEEVEGFHALESGKHLSSGDLVRLAKKDYITIGVKEKMGNIIYKVSPGPIKRLVSKLSEKIHLMSNQMTSWKMDPFKHFNMDFLSCSADLMYESRHILVGNIPLDLIKGPMPRAVIEKINAAIKQASATAEISEDCIKRFESSEKYHLTPGDLGARGFNCGKVSVIVELKEPLLVGTSVEGGTAILARL